MCTEDPRRNGLAVSWGVVQVVDQLIESAGLPDWTPACARVLLEGIDQLRLLPSEVRRGIAEDRRIESSRAVEADVAASRERLGDSWLVDRIALAPIPDRADCLAIAATLPSSPDGSVLHIRPSRSRRAFTLSLSGLGLRRFHQILEQIDARTSVVEARLVELTGEGP